MQACRSSGHRVAGLPQLELAGRNTTRVAEATRGAAVRVHEADVGVALAISCPLRTRGVAVIAAAAGEAPPGTSAELHRLERGPLRRALAACRLAVSEHKVGVGAALTWLG